MFVKYLKKSPKKISETLGRLFVKIRRRIPGMTSAATLEKPNVGIPERIVKLLSWQYISKPPETLNTSKDPDSAF